MYVHYSLCKHSFSPFFGLDAPPPLTSLVVLGTRGKERREEGLFWLLAPLPPSLPPSGEICPLVASQTDWLLVTLVLFLFPILSPFLAKRIDDRSMLCVASRVRTFYNIGNGDTLVGIDKRGFEIHS